MRSAECAGYRAAQEEERAGDCGAILPIEEPRLPREIDHSRAPRERVSRAPRERYKNRRFRVSSPAVLLYRVALKSQLNFLLLYRSYHEQAELFLLDPSD